jgi:hypothetical protein
MNDKPFFDTNVILYAFRQDDKRGQLAETLLAAGGALSVQVLNEFVAVARRKLDKSWEEVRRAPLTYFASFVQNPCHLRSRPTREPCTLPSDTGIQSLIHSSSRLRSMLAPAHFTRRTCETARQSMGLQFAIHFRARHTDDSLRFAKRYCYPARVLEPRLGSVALSQ